MKVLMEGVQHGPLTKETKDNIVSAIKNRTKEIPEEQPLFDAFGEMLLTEKHPVLQAYIDHSIKQEKELLQHLAKQETTRAEERMGQIEEELALLQKAKEYMSA